MSSFTIIHVLAACGLAYMFICSLLVTVYLLDKAIDTLPPTSKKVIHLKDRIKKK